MEPRMYRKPYRKAGSISDNDIQKFHQQLCQYEHHVLRTTYEYFQDDLHYIVENLSPYALLSHLSSRKVPNLEKYKDLLNDRKLFARTLVSDIFQLGRDAVIGLWDSLYVLQKEQPLPALCAVLEELCAEGETLAGKILLDEEGHLLHPELKDIQRHHMNHLKNQTEKLVENKPPSCDQRKESFPLCTRYVTLIIVSTYHFRERYENELIETGARHEKLVKRAQNDLLPISPNKIFRWCPQSRLVPQMVMVVGVPGVGKTTLMQKIVYDWVKGDLYQRFSFVFFFKFRELNQWDKVSLETLILHHYPYLWKQLGNIFQDPEKLLFIFDGLDESNQTMDFTSRHLCSDPKQPERCGHIVVSLVRKSLLNGCSVLMTSRPTRLASMDCRVFHRIIEITGFLAEERQIYFDNFFRDPELAEKAFTYVKQNDTLYTFCYLPSYCWIICTVLSRSFQTTSSDQQVSLLPRTVTQLFAIFVANILSNHSLEKSGAQKLLQSIGWMAEHGVMNHRIIFDDRDLESFHVNNKSKLLSSFLMESEEPVSYSFLHLTVQEFFSAFVHYADYSPEKLQESLEKAKSYPDGRGEMFLRFLCGLSHASTRSLLTGYLDTRADQASREVITWLENFILEEQRLEKSKDKKRHLLRTFYYLFESQNKDLVLKLLQSHRVFDFSEVRLSALDCTVLAFIMETCTHIEELNLSKCSIDNEGLERIVPGLYNLRSLSLADNNLRDTSCIHLASVIRNNPSLKRLDLLKNALSGPLLSNLMEALSSPACRIEELHLSSNNLPDTFCIQMASVLRNNQSLVCLNLSDNSLCGPHLSDLMEALSSPACRIEELHLCANNLPDMSCIQLASVLKNNQSLKSLNLSHNSLCGPQLSDLMEALSSPACRIEELQLAYNDLEDTSCIQLASVIRNNQSLKRLNLSGNYLCGRLFNDTIEKLSRYSYKLQKSESDGVYNAAAISLRKSHQSYKDHAQSGPDSSFSMSNQSSSLCRIKALENFGVLMEALSSPACRIEELHLGENDLPCDSCLQLASAIRVNHSLKTLNLSGNLLYGPHFTDLMEALTSPSCRIEELLLAYNNLRDTSCIHLASGIKNNLSLKKLDLSGNHLSGPCLSDLMEVLSSPASRIETLQLFSNELTEEEANALRHVEILKPNLRIFH
ncbi:NACHT, LRR and PYD domains-containing protein 12-like [Engystomops pustulosus]|uniref:NACHT, LRR and PYD domains-containing protein 12-like n=1 Tax=Engystomops pustulosus TaxID=76066 RepID=UPI003AFAE619